MKDKILLEICEKEDLKELDKLIEQEFPLYLHLEDIFDLIMEKDKTNLYYYAVNYLKKHPLNQLTNGNYYAYHYKKIKNYQLFLLLKNHSLVNKALFENIMYNFLQDCNEHIHPELQFENILAIKIMSLNLSR